MAKSHRTRNNATPTTQEEPIVQNQNEVEQVTKLDEADTDLSASEAAELQDGFVQEDEAGEAIDATPTTAVDRAAAASQPKAKSPFPKAVLLQAAEYAALENFKIALGDREVTTPLTFKELHKTTKEWLPNFKGRGLLEYTLDEETGAPGEIKITDKGLQSLENAKTGALKQTPGRKAGEGVARTAKDGAERQTRVRDNKLLNPHYRLLRMTKSNPRREKTHGAYNWELYEDGMTYSDYLKKPFNAELETSTGAKFYGPHPGQLNWDMSKGFIAVYDDREEPKVELKDGRWIDNPAYWVVKGMLSSPEAGAPKAEATATTEEAASE